jgi:hypothetical protein
MLCCFGIGDIRRRAGIQRGHRFRDHVLHGILRQLDLDAGFGLEFFDGFVQRVVFGFVEALDPPHRDFLLRHRRRGRIEKADRGGDCACKRTNSFSFHITLPDPGLPILLTGWVKD